MSEISKSCFSIVLLITIISLTCFIIIFKITYDDANSCSYQDFTLVNNTNDICKYTDNLTLTISDIKCPKNICKILRYCDTDYYIIKYHSCSVINDNKYIPLVLTSIFLGIPTLVLCFVSFNWVYIFLCKNSATKSEKAPMLVTEL